MGWQPTNVIATIGPDGTPRVDWSGPVGAPLQIDVVVDLGWPDHTWLGQARLTPDTPAEAGLFTFGWAEPVEGEDFVRGTMTLVTTGLDVGVCYVYAIGHDDGSGMMPLVDGTLAPQNGILQP